MALHLTKPILPLLGEAASLTLSGRAPHDNRGSLGDQPEALTEVRGLVSTKRSWLQTLTHSSPITGLRVAFPAPSSEQAIGGWLEGRISGPALK